MDQTKAAPRSTVWKKAATATLSVAGAAALALGLFSTQSHHFQHHTDRLLAELASSSSIQVQFTAKNQLADVDGGLTVTALLLPRSTSSQSGLTFDGRLSYEFLGEQFNFTVVDGRGYVTVEKLETGQLVRNECLMKANVPPMHLFADALRDARVVDDAAVLGISGAGCSDGKLVEFAFADEPYVFCSRANGALDKVHGQDIEATVQLLRDNTASAPSVVSLIRPSGKSIHECELLEDDSAEASTVATASTRMLSRAVKRAGDVVQVLSGERRLAETSDCSTACAGGKKVCLFVHGLGKSPNDTVADSYPNAWGEAQTHANCCSETKFVRMDTVNNAWHGDVLSKTVCDAAVELSNSSDPMDLQNIAIIAHSMGNLVVANAAMKNLCAIGASSKWIALSGPISGSASANLAVTVCADKPTFWDDGLIAILTAVDICPAGDTAASIVLEQGALSTLALNELFVQADAAFAKYVTSIMCGVSPTGLLSKDAIKYGALGLISGHATPENDGAVEFASCRGQVPASSFATSWSSGKYYKPSVNHGDVTLRNGDGWWGSDRKPAKWFNCQF